MTFSLSNSFLNTYPKHLIAFGVVKTKVTGPDEESAAILENIYPEVREKYNLEDLPSLPNSLAYEKFSALIGGNRFSFPWMQIKRVLKGGHISNINNVVNKYMEFELLSNLSFSAYDQAAIQGDILVDVAHGDEVITTIGGEEKPVPEGDLIFKDALGIIYSFSNGYADRTKVTPQTTKVLFAIDAPEGIDPKQVEENMKNLCAEFNSKEYYILNEETPSSA